jgi:hypothetical protein
LKEFTTNVTLINIAALEGKKKKKKTEEEEEEKLSP